MLSTPTAVDAVPTRLQSRRVCSRRIYARPSTPPVYACASTLSPRASIRRLIRSHHMFYYPQASTPNCLHHLPITCPCTHACVSTHAVSALTRIRPLVPLRQRSIPVVWTRVYEGRERPNACTQAASSNCRVTEGTKPDQSPLDAGVRALHRLTMRERPHIAWCRANPLCTHLGFAPMCGLG
eukprot:3301619-Prymnesium_polylepis.1